MVRLKLVRGTKTSSAVPRILSGPGMMIEAGGAAVSFTEPTSPSGPGTVNASGPGKNSPAGFPTPKFETCAKVALALYFAVKIASAASSAFCCAMKSSCEPFMYASESPSIAASPRIPTASMLMAIIVSISVKPRCEFFFVCRISSAPSKLKPAGVRALPAAHPARAAQYRDGPHRLRIARHSQKHGAVNLLYGCCAPQFAIALKYHSRRRSADRAAEYNRAAVAVPVGRIHISRIHIKLLRKLNRRRAQHRVHRTTIRRQKSIQFGNHHFVLRSVS